MDDSRIDDLLDKHFSLFTDFDIYLFKMGKHYKLYQKLGAHVQTFNGVEGTYFAIWAPNAMQVSVIGNFNCWDTNKHYLNSRWDSSGIWELFIPHVKKGEVYKFSIKNRAGDYIEKADPFAFYAEIAPATASIVWDHTFDWKDEEWLQKRLQTSHHPKPISVYEVHLGSWRRKLHEGNRSLSYVELADELTYYVKEAGFTHVEFLPVMEHPFFGSWGYQITGYFAPSSRYGNPQELMYLIDTLHRAGIGVICDWVPSHFPGDGHGLHQFDGTFLYEYADPRKGFHPDWSSYIFNYGRNEVRSFLISSALFWLEVFHCDGLRVDAVASMLYLDYSRQEGHWEPNHYGGNENIEAISFLKEFNEVVYDNFPDVVTIAEESTSWTGVSRPTNTGGLGFGQKWMMGWMHDTLRYFKLDSIYRKYHQDDITFSIVYAFTENFMLPFSHDEVVHGKGSLLAKMPGDDWQKFANLRLMYSYMFTHPGTKLLFMGAEFGQKSEWNHDGSLTWDELNFNANHQGILKVIKSLNILYKNERALYHFSFDHRGFQWIDFSDRENTIIIYLRKSEIEDDLLLIACNFTPESRLNYRIGVPHSGIWREIFNSDDLSYGGSGIRNLNNIISEPIPYQHQNQSVVVTLPPLAATVLKLNKKEY